MPTIKRTQTGLRVDRRTDNGIRYFLGMAGICLALGGCDRIAGSAPVSLAALDGTYRGEMVQKSGRPTYCVLRADLALTLRRGEARGELTSVQQPGQPVGSFYAFVEPDGRIKTTARVGTQTLAVDGRFTGQEFRASAEGQDCSMAASARRADGG
jgi:hypothetical protein